MAAKTTGAEIKRFYTDPAYWPEDDGNTYHEDEYVEVDGVPLAEDASIADIPDAAIVKIDGGIVFSDRWEPEQAPSFDTYFKRWKKEQNTVSLVVECDKSKLDAVMEAIKAAGGKVVAK